MSQPELKKSKVDISKTITVLPGDHVGEEVCNEAIKVLQAIEEATPYRNIKFNLQKHLIGGAAIDATGNPLPDESLEARKILMLSY